MTHTVIKSSMSYIVSNWWICVLKTVQRVDIFSNDTMQKTPVANWDGSDGTLDPWTDRTLDQIDNEDNLLESTDAFIVESSGSMDPDYTTTVAVSKENNFAVSNEIILIVDTTTASSISVNSDLTISAPYPVLSNVTADNQDTLSENDYMVIDYPLRGDKRPLTVDIEKSTTTSDTTETSGDDHSEFDFPPRGDRTQGLVTIISDNTDEEVIDKMDSHMDNWMVAHDPTKAPSFD